MSGAFSERNRVEVLAEEFLARYRRGEGPSLTDYAARFPDLAEEIREVFPALLLVEEAGPRRAGHGEPRESQRPGGDRVPERLGDFRIIREVGRGGMGVVYEAVQESLGRRVALKVLPRGLLDRPSALKRFHRETHLVAALHHSNIVQVFGVGEDEGHHYYAMQFIRGQTLEAVLEDVRRLRDGADASSGGSPTDAATGALGLLTGQDDADATIDEVEYGRVDTLAGEVYPTAIRPRVAGGGGATRATTDRDRSPYHERVARIGLQVADALAYAHDQGVLHRDIKPSNLLVDRQGTVWVVDFGLAKPDGGENLSATRDVVGTIRYMAPERFDGRSDRRGDVYSLGVTLYELLTLRPAFAASDQARLVREVMESSPPPPRAIDRRVPRDLETIVLKAMAKEPSARYATAGALAEDLRRFLEDRTILARRSTAIERSRRWCRRNPAVAALLTSVAVLLTFTAVYASAAATRYKRQFERASQAESLGREKLFSAYLAEARASRFSRRPGQRFASLRSLEEAAKIRRTPEIRDEAIASLALPDIDEVYRSPRTFDGCLLAFDPTLERYARLDWDGVVSVRRVADDGEVRRFPSPGPIAGESFVLAFSPDGRRLVVDYGLAKSRKLIVWGLDRDKPLLLEEGSLFYGVRCSPAGGRMAIWRDQGPATIINHESGAVEGRWEVEGRITSIAFSPDGRRAAVCFHSSALKLQIREVPSGNIERVFDCPGESSLDWSPDGTTLAVGSSSVKRVELYDVETGRRTGVLPGEMGAGMAVKFQPASGWLATQSWLGKLQFWRPRTGEPPLSLPAGNVIDFRADGARVAIVVAGPHPAIFQIAGGGELRTLVREPARRHEGVIGAALHPGGRLLAVAMTDGVGLWDVDRDVAVASLPIGYTSSVLFGPGGELLTAGHGGILRWPVSCDGEGKPGQVRIGPPTRLADFRSGRFIAQSRDGRYLAIDGPAGATILDDQGLRRPTRLGPQHDVRSLAISPDGRWAATGSHLGGEGVKVWSLPDGRLVDELASAGGPASAQFSPDGRWLSMNQSRSNSCRLRSVGDWKEGPRMIGSGLGFSPDGRLLVVDRGKGIVALIEAETGRVVANLEDPNQCGFRGAIFSPDGAHLYLPSDEHRAAYVWDLRSIRRQLTAMGLDWDWPALPESAAPATTVAPLRVVIDVGTHDFSQLPFSQAEIERLDAALASDPDEWYALLRRGWIFTQCGRDAEAVADFTRALGIRPGHHLALTTRAESLLRQGRYESCLADYESALSGAPDQAAAHNTLAWIYATAAPPALDPTKALPHARRAVELMPKVAIYRNTLGVVLARLGRHRESADELEASLAASSGGEAAYDLFFLAIDYHRLGDPARAKACYDRAIRHEVESPLPSKQIEELRAFHAEAKAVLSTPIHRPR